MFSFFFFSESVHVSLLSLSVMEDDIVLERRGGKKKKKTKRKLQPFSHLQQTRKGK